MRINVIGMVFWFLIMMLAGCGGGSGGENPASNGSSDGVITFQSAKSSTNSFYPTSDGVNSVNQPVSLHWKYVLSGSSQKVTIGGYDYTLQTYEDVYDPTAQKISEGVTYSASGNGLSVTSSESNYFLLTSAGGKLYSKESGGAKDIQGTQNGQSQHVTGSVTQVNQSPYLELFLGRSDLGSLGVGFTATVQATATQTFTSSSGASSTQTGQITQNWQITNTYPSMTIQGRTYTNVIEATQNDIGQGTTSVYWVAKGIGVIKATRPVNSLNGYVATFELKDTNLSQ